MKTCRDCTQWEHAGGQWGYCTLITSASGHLGVNVQIIGLDNYGDIKYSAEAFLETDDDFSCNKIMVEK